MKSAFIYSSRQNLPYFQHLKKKEFVLSVHQCKSNQCTLRYQINQQDQWMWWFCTCLRPENMKASLGSTDTSTSWTKLVLFCRWYLTGKDSLTRPNDGRSLERKQAISNTKHIFKFHSKKRKKKWIAKSSEKFRKKDTTTRQLKHFWQVLLEMD